MITVFLRTLIIYVILVASMRLMGKRQIGELQLSELVTTFMLSELAVIPISDKHTPVAYAVLPILLLLSLEVILSFLLTKSALLKRLFLGKPSIVIRSGELNQTELGRQRITVYELLSELRLKNIASVSDVEYAILEENGKLSVFPKVAKAPVTPEELGQHPAENGIAHPLIVDGRLSHANLRLTGKSERWVAELLSKNNVSRKDVFLLTVDDGGNIVLTRKETRK